MKILFVTSSGIGNTIQTIPAYLSLKEIAEITVVYEKVYPTDSVRHCDIFPADVEEVDAVWINANRDKYDYVYKPWHLSKDGYYVKEATDALREGDSEVQRNMKAIECLGASQEIQRKWEMEGFAPVGDYITVHNGANPDPAWYRKKYPLFPRLIEMLREDHRIVCVGSEDEYMKGCINKTGIPLKETTHIINDSQLHICTDTSTMHIAGLTETPCVAIFTCTSQSKNLDAEFHKTVTPVSRDISCSPCQACFHWSPRSSNCVQGRAFFPCQNIDPEVIYNEIQDKLSK